MVPVIVCATVVFHAVIVLGHLASRRRYARIRARGPRRPVLDSGELSPFELGMLAGGRQRMGEVALAELYLGGCVVARGHGTVSRPCVDPAPSASLVRSPHPVTRIMADRLPPKGVVSAEELLGSPAHGDQATSVLWRLRRLGLLFPPPKLRGVRRIRRAACGLHTLAGITAAIVGPLLLLLGMRPDSGPGGVAPMICAGLLLTYPYSLHLSRRAMNPLAGAVTCGAVATGVALVTTPLPTAASAAPVLLGCWFAAHGVYLATGGRLGPRTVAGDALLDEARTPSAGAPYASGPTGALRCTALLGFRLLRRRAAAGRPAPPELGLVRSFAAACGRGVGRPDSGLGGNFSGDGGSGLWRGDGDTTTAAPNRPG